MIHTSRQLKALVRNQSKGDSAKAQIIIRNYAMERFMERLSVSDYRGKLIMKGGVLISAMVGAENRSTMDVDATVKELMLSEESARRIVEDICAVPIEDGMAFEIVNVATIMEDADYSGVRVTLDATLETMHTPLKIDFSSGDVITPREISYSFRLMFEDRTISMLTYNLETILAEKLETILSRGSANTRMRDFYDIFALEGSQSQNIDISVLQSAFVNTCGKRGSLGLVSDVDLILNEIETNANMRALWENYKRKFEYAANISWDEIMRPVQDMMMRAIG